MSNRREIIYISLVFPSLNTFFGAVKNPKIKPNVLLKLIKALTFEQAHLQNRVHKQLEKIIEEKEILPFTSGKPLSLSYVPFYGEETGKTFNKKTRKSRKDNNRNPLDCVNYAPTMKAIEDKLVKLEILEEDNYKIIPTNHILPAVIDREYQGHGIFIIIEEMDKIPFRFTKEMKDMLIKIKK